MNRQLDLYSTNISTRKNQTLLHACVNGFLATSRLYCPFIPASDSYVAWTLGVFLKNRDMAAPVVLEYLGKDILKVNRRVWRYLQKGGLESFEVVLD